MRRVGKRYREFLLKHKIKGVVSTCKNCQLCHHVRNPAPLERDKIPMCVTYDMFQDRFFKRLKIGWKSGGFKGFIRQVKYGFKHLLHYIKKFFINLIMKDFYGYYLKYRSGERLPVCDRYFEYEPGQMPKGWYIK